MWWRTEGRFEKYEVWDGLWGKVGGKIGVALIFLERGFGVFED